MVLSLLVLGLILVATLRGWYRGVVLEVVDLVALVAAVVAATGVGSWLGRVLADWVGWPLAATRVSVGLVVMVAGSVGVIALSRWLRAASVLYPGAGGPWHGAGGAAFAATWSTVLITAVLVLATSVPGARLRVAGPICDAPLARALLGDDNPVAPAGARLARIARPLVLEVSRALRGPLTLGSSGLRLAQPRPPAAGVCAEVELRRRAAGTPAGESYRFERAAAAELQPRPDAARQMLELVNEARAAADLPPVVHDALLAAVATSHVTDMYRRGYVAHETLECEMGPDTPGCRDPFDRLRDAGVDYDVAGENLALAPSITEAHRGLLDSPAHRANILDPAFTHLGIAVIEGPYGLLVAQEFRG